MVSVGDSVTAVLSSQSANTRFQLRSGEVLTVLSLHEDGNWALCRNKGGLEDYVAISNLMQANTRGPHNLSPSPVKRSYSGASLSTALPSHKEEFQEATSGADEEFYDNDEVYFKIIKDHSFGGDLVVRAGDIVKAVKGGTYTSRSGRIFAESLRTAMRGWVAESNVTEASSLEMKPWYFESISREQTENLLQDPSLADGTFLVRMRISDSSGKHVISYKEGPSVRHRLINSHGDKMYAWAPHEFDSIDELVEAHSDGLTCTKTLGPPYDKTPVSKRPAPPVPPPSSCRRTQQDGLESSA